MTTFKIPDPNEGLLELALEIDRMEQDVTSWEAEFLESVIVSIRDGVVLTPNQRAKLKEIYEKYKEKGWL